ncbi:MAG: M64 family metallopeptidase, partial [bacterium]
MSSSLLPSLSAVYDALFNFAQSDGFWANLETAFGTNYDVIKATELRQQWQSRNFSQLPEIEVVNSSVLGSANGAYGISTNKIYLSESFFASASSDALVAVMLEEIGHFVDAQVNTVDTVGDEGELFSHLVRGVNLTEAELTYIQTEDDRAVINLGGQFIGVEQTAPITLIVNTTIDENDGSATIGTGLSLRDAVAIANKSPNTPFGAGFTTIINNGPSSNRVDVVFLGDGYTSTDLMAGSYDSHVNTYVDYMFSNSLNSDPFYRYRNYFNIHKIDVVSNESGADVPPDNIFRDTALDASYYFDGSTERLLYIDNN